MRILVLVALVVMTSPAQAQRVAAAGFTQPSGESGSRLAMLADESGPPPLVVHVVYGALAGIAVAAVGSGVIAVTARFDEYAPAGLLIPLALAAGAVAGSVVGVVVYVVRGSGMPRFGRH